MKYVVSRYNHDTSWLKDYTNDVAMFDRSEKPLWGARVVQNIGSDIYDKFTYIIENYDNLPDVAVYTKANLFKYITKGEFELIKDSTTFTPLLTQFHKTQMPVNYYENKMYYEINNRWYLAQHPTKTPNTPDELFDIFGTANEKYLCFAPGSNYIVPKENILKHPKSLYERLRSYLDWAIYPGEAQIIERNMYYLWS